MNLTRNISPLQYAVFIFNITFGAGLLTLPRSVADAAKEDMWLAVLAGGGLMLFSFWVAARVAGYFPEHTYIEYHRLLLGPLLGQALNVLVLALIVLLTALALRSFVIVAHLFLLDRTPPQVLVAALLVLAVYSMQYGLLPLIRMQQFLFIPNYSLLFIIILLGFLVVNPQYYQPMLAEGFTPVLQGAVPSWFSYSGPELATGLLYPFITRQKAVFRWGAAAIAALIFVYTLTTLIVQGILGPGETRQMLVPTITALREVEIPDTFIERLDGYLMIFWISIYFISLANLFYCITLSAGRMLKLEDSRPLAALFLPLVYFLANLPPNYQTILAVNKWLNMAGMAWGLVILPALLGLAWLKNKGRSMC